MAQTIASGIYREDDCRSVTADITYLKPGSAAVNRRFVSPGMDVNTGEYQPFAVTIRDGRDIKSHFQLATHGFTLRDHPSAVSDFLDREMVNSLYPAEALAAVREITGADCVAPMGGWMIRTSGDVSRFARPTGPFNNQGHVQPPAAEAHVDTCPARSVPLAQRLYDLHFPGGRPYRRFIVSSLWRAFSDGPQDCPLAVCDGNSVADDEGVNNTMIIVDELPSPEQMLKPIPNEDQLPAATIFHFNAGHRWWYFSNMHRDEVLLFKFYDSNGERPWRTPHTAFHDPSFRNPQQRFSIEYRTVAYFL